MKKLVLFSVTICLALAGLSVTGNTEISTRVAIGDDTCERLATAVDHGEHGEVRYCQKWSSPQTINTVRLQ